MIYLDSSALVTLIVGRQNAKELGDFLDAHGAVRGGTSTVGFVETVRICDQIGSYPNLMASLVQDYAEVALDREIREAAAALPGNVRSLDAIHVASAEALGSGLTTLVTYDVRLANVARAVGLPVAMPGVE